MSSPHLPDPRAPVSADQAQSLEQELRRELRPDHALAGIEVACLARRADQDDGLFRLRGHESEFAIVHLTWTRESVPEWPATTLFANAEDLADNWRRIDE
jgi:hypothetical protein